MATNQISSIVEIPRRYGGRQPRWPNRPLREHSVRKPSSRGISIMRPGGFTLIEMLVVVAIIALMALMTLPSITGYYQVSINAATRDLATIVKQTYNSAVVTGRIHRIVYDLKEHNYWVESSLTHVLLDTKETKEKEERKKKFQKSSESAESSPFNLERTVTRKKVSLPRGVVYEDIVTQQSLDPISEGKAYTHFFPHGLTEQTIIHLKDNSKHHSSLVITPLIGMSDVYGRYVNGKEIFKKD